MPPPSWSRQLIVIVRHSSGSTSRQRGRTGSCFTSGSTPPSANKPSSTASCTTLRRSTNSLNSSIFRSQVAMATQWRRSILIKVGLPALVLVLIAAGVLLYIDYARWESTDDAQIDGYIYPLTSRVSGYVQRVTVNDNQYVEAGTVIVQLDPRDFEVAVATARALMANQEANSVGTRLNIPLTSVNTSSQLSSAGANVDNA